ncbi:MAG TPA: ABC transporter permease [Vicinamibacterales bacterium]|nr:ABC transporter permease [Vicinamibacterales bacterium]
MRDIKFALRQFGAQPGFTAVALLTLAIGIGATSAIFSAVHAVVLQPLPYPAPERLVNVYEDYRGRPGGVSAGNFTDARNGAGTFESMAAAQYSSFNLSRENAAERITGARVTASFFDVLGVQPALGRPFTAAEDEPGQAPVVVLSHRLWARRFGSDPSVVGGDVRLGGQAYRVLGVMPASFDLTADSEELWVPIAFTAERKATHDEHYLTVYGRLKPGVSRQQALRDLTRLVPGIQVVDPKHTQQLGFMVIPMTDDVVGDYRGRLFVLLGAVSFVLLIACGNLANLLLARGAARSGELAIRAALGAGRARIVRQLLTESLLLALSASILGLALAQIGIRVLVSMSPPGVPRLEQAGLDGQVIAFTIGVALVCALIFGLAPAMRAARTDVQTGLRSAGRSAGSGGVRDRLRTALIAGELALALLLLSGASLLIQSAIALQRVPPGFNAEGVLSARLSLPADQYGTATQAQQAFEAILEQARAIPGVRAAGITSQVPRGRGGNGNGLIPEGRTPDAANAIGSRLRMVTPGYFDAMGIPITRGRALTDQDRRGGLKVMVISEALARAAWPDQDPIGRRIICCEAAPDGGPDYKTVVGVAGDVRSNAPGDAPTPEFYLPIAQVPPEAWTWIQRTMYVVVRTPGDPSSAGGSLREAVRRVAPDVPLFDVRTMEERLGASLSTARFNMTLLTLLGGIGLLLAAIGIYGVMGYFVTRRTQEIGVRMALGATRADVVRLIVRQAAAPVAIGLAAGVLASLALTSVLQAQLFGVSPRDPLTLMGAAVLLAVVGLVASLVPARRAASIDPTRALRAS